MPCWISARWFTGPPWRLAVNQAGGAFGVETQHPMGSMPVRSILSSHAQGSRLPAGTRSLDLRGAAWAGDLSVRAVDVSVDFGAI